MSVGLQPRRAPRWLLHFAGRCCASRAELRAVLREDAAFQRSFLEGRDPHWLFRNWRPTDKRLKRQRASWIVTALLARHVHLGAFFGILGCVLVPVWLVMTMRHQIGNWRVGK